MNVLQVLSSATFHATHCDIFRWVIIRLPIVVHRYHTFILSPLHLPSFLPHLLNEVLDIAQQELWLFQSCEMSALSPCQPQPPHSQTNH